MNWHALSVEALLEETQTNPHRGLTAGEAEKRLADDGPNELPEGERRGPLKRLLRQFTSPLIYVLMIAGVVTFLLDDYLDTWVIGTVVVVNALIGFIQEGKAEKALDAVRGLLAEKAVVLRDGETLHISAVDLVVGDVVQLESGAKVPADVRIIEARNLAAAEAMLTGESVPVEKHVAPVDDDTAVGDRTSMLYAGTLVTSGVATAVVVATGTDTELGRIGVLVGEVGDVKTPLTKRLDRFAGQITIAIIAIGAVAFVYGYRVLDATPQELFIIAVGLVVAAIPEGLPAIVTIVLAIGTRVMASNGALIRRLPAVESLGSVSIIWSDKTGTLTQNEMMVSTVVTSEVTADVTGSGYSPDGEFLVDGEVVTADSYDTLATLVEAAILCNRADVKKDKAGDYQPVGDPTEVALVTLALKGGVSKSGISARYPQVDQIPFESHRRFMATLHDNPDGGRLVWLKGAPERVLELADASWDGSALDRDWWQKQSNRLAEKGQRVLALAGASWSDDDTFSGEAEVPGLRLLGIVGVIDPPREAAKEAIATCQSAGIRVKMITGDHLLTAAAIGKQLGLLVGTPLSGSEIDHLDDAQLLARIADTDVIARANPEHKLRLVRLVQDAGFQAAMTGDGVNDAPALQAADIGVAMGKNGTDAARSASDLVLTDDRFETIERAVERGRIVFDNIKKSMLHILPTNLGEILIILVALFAGWTLPVTASQILWINLVIAVTVALALVVEKAEPDLMKRPPRPANEALITRRFLARLILIGVLIAGSTLWLFEWLLSRGYSLEEARGAAVTMVVVAETWYLFNVRRFTATGFTLETFFGSRVALGTSALLLGLQAMFLYVPVMNALFGTAPLNGYVLGVIFSLGAGIFVIVELEKWLWRRSGVTSF
jgi:magnesium-transporting ATPase (P-type)